MTKTLKFLVAFCLAFVAPNVFAAFRANTPVSRVDDWWAARHAEKVAALADSSVKKDIVFIGDELTQDWETTGAAALASHFTGDKAMFNLGFDGDCTENVLWRIQNGEIGSPKAIFLMVGGNNSAIYTKAEEGPGKTIRAVRDIIDYLAANYSSAKIVVQAILPRGLDESDPVRPRNDLVNNEIRRYAQANGCTWVDMSDLFLESDHHALKPSLFNADHATLNASGYEVWAQTVAPYVDAASSGAAMPADFVATARPANMVTATYPSSKAVMENFFWEKYLFDISAIGGKSYDIVLLGDSITQKWSSSDPDSMNGLGSKVFNLGRTGDFTENLLWRLEGGCLDGYTTKFFNLLIGTNNTIQREPAKDDPADIAAGVKAVLDLVLAKHPESKVLLMPILPYGYTNAQHNATGMAQYANNEAANEIIKTYADGQRVILVDVRSQFLNADGTFKGEMYLEKDGDYPDMFLHLSAKGYREIMAPAISAAMAAAGASSVTLPALGDVAAQVSGTSATIALSGVTKGTDTNGVAASSYSVLAKLDTAAEATVLTAQTGATASFSLADLADGWHSCAVMVKTGDGMVSAPKRVKFLVDSQADAVGWKVAPMTADGSAIRGDGTQVFAIAKGGDTAGGVTFASSSDPSNASLETTPAKAGGDGWGLGVNNNIINAFWWWNMSGTSTDVTFKLKGLTSGRKYLVQIVASHYHNSSGITVSAGDIAPVTANDSNDYKYGAVITRVFEASGSTENVVVNFSGSSSKFEVKAIQLRELGEGGGGESGGGESGGGETGGGESGGGEELTGEFVKQTFIASNKLQLPYRVAAKADPNGGKVPVVVFLHGYGQCGVDNSFTINEITNIKSYLDGAGAPSGYKLLVPQCPNDVKWADFSMNSTTCTFVDKPSSALVAVFDLLDSYAAMADVDANRIYVTGLSMGGHGTWDAICRRPDFFAAAMPCCGGGDPACAADIAHVPILAVHNRGDPTIPVEQTEGIVTALRALGSDVIFEKLENNSHDAWTTCYSRTDDITPSEPNHRFVWMFAQNRATNNRPKYPRITELAAAPSGSSATISLAGVVLGTDANSVPATKYSVAYKLDGASSAVTALTDQTTDSSFTLEGLADGNHTCEVTMTTDKGRTKTKSVVFYVNTSAVPDVWTSTLMDASGNSFSTEGTFVYGYVCNGGTINGIPFERSINLQSSENPPKISFSPNIDGFTGDFMNEGVSGNFGLSLGNGWYWNWDGAGTHTVTLTLSNLEGGKKYLVQFLAHNSWNNTTTVSANGCDPMHIHGDNEASGKYGALITGVFTASGATKDVTITYRGGSGKMPFNAVQVREISDGGSGGGDGPGPVDPEPTPVCALTIPTKTGLALQSVTTNGVAVSAVGGSYTIVSNTQVTVNFAAADGYEIVSGNPVVFTITGAKTFVNADYPVVQATSGGGGDEPDPVLDAGWTATALGSTSASIRTDGTLVYAYAYGAYTVNGVTFISGGAAGIDNANCTVNITHNSSTTPPADTESGDYKNLLGAGWYGYEGVRTVTLRNLTVGKKYLVQIIASRSDFATQSAKAPDGVTTIKFGGTGWEYGGSLTGVFTAEAATQEFMITYTGNSWINGIQVREIGESGGEPGPVDPEPTPTCSLTIPAKTGIVLQSVTTNGVAVAAVADSYTIVSNTQVTVNFAAAEGYEIVGGNPVVFTLSGDKTFSDADYPVVQATSGGGGDEPGPVPQIPWTVATLPSSDETMLRTEGTLLYAYRGASTDRALGGVTFQAGADLSSANISFNPTFNNADENAGSSSLLGTAWNFGVDTGMGEIHLTLSGLTAGHAYLLQILARNSFGNPSITIGDLPAVSIQNGSGSSGATVYGSFTAEAASHVVTFKMGGSGAGRFVAAVQVRDLGESSGGGSGGGETVEPIVPGPDTTNTLHLAKVAEYAFASNGCGAITYSGQGGIFYVLQDHDDDGYAKIHPLSLGIDPSTGEILSQNLGATFTPAGLRDAEGLALDPLSGTLWASSEWTPPSITEFGIDGAATSRTAPVPAIQRTKLRSNLSLESLTISPDGLTMWTANEQALTCDGESSSGNTNVATVVRLTRFTRATAQDNWQAAGEWAYACDPCANATFAECGLSGLCALPDGSLLALEREVSIATWGRCRIYRITTGALAAATEVSNLSSVTNATVSLVAKGSPLVSFTGTDLNNIIVYEGIALGPKLGDGSRSLVLVSDGGATMTKTYGPVSVTAKTVSRICALKLTGLADDGEPALIQDWPANPDVAITDETRPSDLGIVAGAFASSGTTTAELRKLSRWASAHNVPYAGVDVNSMTFDANGNPGTLHATAYLLNCAVAEVEESSAAFKFTAITPGMVPTIEGNFNGRVTVYGADELAGPWQIATEQHHFFKATLTR